MKIKYATILAAILAVAGTARAQGQWQSYSGRPDLCLVVSANGNQFKYRDSWGYETTKRSFKNSDLAKIAKGGVEVIRLPKDATDADVAEQIARCQRTIFDRQPGAPVETKPQPHFIPIASYLTK